MCVLLPSGETRNYINIRKERSRLWDRSNKRAIPALAIIQGVADIGGMMIKGINALVDAKRASSFNNAIKLINENIQITHDRLITLEILFFYISKTLEMIRISFMASLLNAVL